MPFREGYNLFDGDGEDFINDDWTFDDEDDILDELCDEETPCIVLPNTDTHQKFSFIVSYMKSLAGTHTGNVIVEMSRDKPYATAVVEIPAIRGDDRGLEDILSIIRHADAVAVNTLPNSRVSIHATINRMFVVI